MAPRITLSDLPDELILNCFLFLTDAPRALIAFSWVSKQIYHLSLTNSLWVGVCQQHDILPALVVATMGEEVLKKGSFDARSVFTQNITLFKPCRMLSVYYPSYESGDNINALLIKNPRRKLYLTPELASKLVPNISSVKKFLKLHLTVGNMGLEQLSKGIMTHTHAIPQEAIIGQIQHSYLSPIMR